MWRRKRAAFTSIAKVPMIAHTSSSKSACRSALSGRPLPQSPKPTSAKTGESAKVLNVLQACSWNSLRIWRCNQFNEAGALRNSAFCLLCHSSHGRPTARKTRCRVWASASM